MAPRSKPTAANEDLGVLDRDDAAVEARRTLPTADEVGPWGRLARLALEDRDHQRRCPVVDEGRGRVEASPEVRTVAPGPEAQAEGIEPGDYVTRVACLECGAARLLKGTRREALRAVAEAHSPTTGADTVLA